MVGVWGSGGEEEAVVSFVTSVCAAAVGGGMGRVVDGCVDWIDGDDSLVGVAVMESRVDDCVMVMVVVR